VVVPLLVIILGFVTKPDPPTVVVETHEQEIVQQTEQYIDEPSQAETPPRSHRWVSSAIAIRSASSDIRGNNKDLVASGLMPIG